MTPEQKQRLHEEQLARAEAMEPQLLAQLEDPDPELRLDAVEDLPVEGEGSLGGDRVQRMAAVIAKDPDRRVRIAAVERLEDAAHPDALRVLVDTLSDPDPGVVLQAIEALEFIDDRSVIPDLEPLTRDPNPEVREAAEFAIEYLQW